MAWSRVCSERPSGLWGSDGTATMAALGIRERAEEVRFLGTNLGLFELLLWGEVAQCRVTLLLGATELDVRGFCGGDLPPMAAAVTHYFAGVVLRGRVWLAACGLSDILRINHYLSGLRAETAAAVADGVAVPKRASDAAALAGWRLLPTAAQGDCCVDCMAHWAGRPRTLETFAEIRLTLAEFALSVADDPRWQAAFRHCAEGPETHEIPFPAGVSLPAPVAPLPSPLRGDGAAPGGENKGTADAFALPDASPPGGTPPSTPAKRPRAGYTSPRGSLEAGGGLAGGLAAAAAAPALLEEPAAGQDGPEAAGGAAAALVGLSPAPSAASLAGTPVAAAGRAGFQKWLQDMPEEARQARVRSYADFLEAQAEFAALVPKRQEPASLVERGPRAVRRATRLRERLAIGVAYQAWRQAEGKASQAPLVDFMKSQRRYSGRVPKKDTVWLARCARLAAADDFGQLGVVPRGACGGKRPPTHEGRTPSHLLLRQRLRQGPPVKCPIIRELLWDWFVDIRASVASRISPRLLLAKARQLADQVLREQRKTHAFEPMPVLDKHWLLRFKRDHGIVFRRPNMRFKCSKAVLLARLSAMWRNTIAVRRLAEHFLSTDLKHAFIGIDEKPLHFNEGGSKAARTLDIAGQPSVRLKENHAATRARLSVMTSVVSNLATASDAKKMPVELLFRGTHRKIAKLRTPAGMQVTVAFGPKGSYREDTIVQFIDRHLPPWTEERAASKDYGVLMLDVASSHCGDAVWQAAWAHGFVTLLHYGCTTGVAQVNDTALHGPLSRVYIDLEQAFFNEQQLHEPGNINRRPQDVVNDLCGAWRSLDHRMGVRGHLHNGLTIALDGSEDHLLAGEARHCWHECGMAAVRARTLQEVDARVASGELTSFEQWRSVVRHPDSRGIVWDEGAELEGELVPGELLWLHEGAAAEESADLADLENLEEEKPTALVQAAVTAEGAEAVAEACAQAERLAKLKDLRRQIGEVRLPTIAFHMDREILQAERGMRVPTGESPEAAALLRKALQAKAAAEAAKLAKQREKFRARMHRLQQARLLASKRKREEAAAAALAKASAARAKEEAASAAAARTAELQRLPLTFQPHECDGKTAAAFKTRAACLQRVKLKSPQLPDDLEVEWPKLRDEYCLRFPDTVVGASGTAFLRDVNSVLKRLRTHYDGRTEWNNPPVIGGQRDAFELFVRRMRARVPSSAFAASV